MRSNLHFHDLGFHSLIHIQNQQPPANYQGRGGEKAEAPLGLKKVFWFQFVRIQFIVLISLQAQTIEKLLNKQAAKAKKEAKVCDLYFI